MEKIQKTLEKEGFDCSLTPLDELKIHQPIPRFMPFDEAALMISSSPHFGNLHFMLNFVFFMWEDEAAFHPEEYQRRAELVDNELIPALTDLFISIIDKFNLSIELEFDEGADLSLEANFRNDQWLIIVDLIREIRETCQNWEGYTFHETACEWAQSEK